MKLRTTLVVVPLALLAACGGDEDPPEGEGGKAGNAGASVGKGGASGKAGSAGKGGAAGATNGGGAGTSGKAGAGGAGAGAAGSAGASNGGNAGLGGAIGGAGGNAGASAAGNAGASGAGIGGANVAGATSAGSAGAGGATGGSSAGGSNGGTQAAGSGAGGSAGAATAGNAGAGLGGSDAGGTNAGGNAGTNAGGNAGTNAGGNGGTNAGGNGGTNAGGNAGTTAGGNGGTNAGGSGGSGGAGVDPLAALDDEFDDASTAAAWTDLYPAKHAVLDIDVSRDGFLTMVPVAQSFTGWYSEYEGPLYYKNVTGNFVVETSITLGTANDRTVTPTLANSFAQGGFVIRDPASAAHVQRWIMYNLGYQDNAVAREIKTTVPSANGAGDSLSTLNLNNVTGGLNQGRLRVCRVGSVLRFYHRHPNESAWVEETFRTTGPAPTRVAGNGPRPARSDDSPLSFDRPDFAATLQIGLYVGNYVPPPNGVRGELDYARFGTVASVTDCTKDL